MKSFLAKADLNWCCNKPLPTREQMAWIPYESEHEPRQLLSHLFIFCKVYRILHSWELFNREKLNEWTSRLLHQQDSACLAASSPYTVSVTNTCAHGLPHNLWRSVQKWEGRVPWSEIIQNFKTGTAKHWTKQRALCGCMVHAHRRAYTSRVPTLIPLPREPPCQCWVKSHSRDALFLLSFLSQTPSSWVQPLLVLPFLLCFLHPSSKLRNLASVLAFSDYPVPLMELRYSHPRMHQGRNYCHPCLKMGKRGKEKTERLNT